MNVGSVRDGGTFNFPDTMSVVTALSSSNSLKRPGAIVWVGSWVCILLTPVLYFKNILPLWFFVAHFLLWRAAYNLGLGLILKSQSSTNSFEKFYEEAIRHPTVRWFMESSVVFADNSSYRISDYPVQFNAWMMFRQLENVVLANDLSSYVALSIVCIDFSFSSFWRVPFMALGVSSVVFSLWSKTDAHRVIGEFAWYWGDFFFLQKKSLTFDGIFQMFPHPMYTVGYTFVYGVPLICNSHVLLWAGVLGHLAQYGFLIFVEDPHIQKVYSSSASLTDAEKERQELMHSVSEGEPPYFDIHQTVFLKNLSLSKTADVVLLLGVGCLALCFVLGAPLSSLLWLHVGWRLLLHVGLGCLLHLQSQSQWFSKLFSSPRVAFRVWKSIYNVCYTMSVVSFLCCVLKAIEWNVSWLTNVVVVDLAVVLFSCSGYAICSGYSCIGDYGFYFGDFFFPQLHKDTSEDGIFRYVVDPDCSVGIGAFYGAALLTSNVWVVLFVLLSHVLQLMFTELVEKPNIMRVYGSVRSRGGFLQEVRRSWHQDDKKKA